ncbi:MAG TPA: hypothetical protein PK263_04820 [bacterium]|nr:hypothetical protein [bacterium]
MTEHFWCSIRGVSLKVVGERSGETSIDLGFPITPCKSTLPSVF